MQFLNRLKGTRLTRSDGYYLLLKLLFVMLMFLLPIVGLIIVILTFFTIDRLVMWKYGLLPLNSTDKNVWYD